MNARTWLLPSILMTLIAGCSNPDSVMFVTNTSIGLDLDAQPTTASIGYSRVEGYVGPRYDNGALPPVVASLETGGGIINPSIRQVYATGAAAAKAVSTPHAQDGPATLSGDPSKKKLVFFGTTTTIGVKATFVSCSSDDTRPGANTCGTRPGAD